MDNKNQPAFPQPIAEIGGVLQETADYNATAVGLSKREWMATMMLQGIISATFGKHEGWTNQEHNAAVRDSVYIADSLLGQLSK